MSDSDCSDSDGEAYETADDQEQDVSDFTKTELVVCKCGKCSVPEETNSFCCTQFAKVQKECQNNGS